MNDDWPYEHVTRAAIQQEYEQRLSTLRSWQEEGKELTFRKRLKIRHDQHHYPGFFLQAKMEEDFIEYIQKRQGTQRLVEPGMEITYTKNPTRENIVDDLARDSVPVRDSVGVRADYDIFENVETRHALLAYEDKPEQLFVVSEWDVELYVGNSLYAAADSFTLIGPHAESKVESEIDTLEDLLK